MVFAKQLHKLWVNTFYIELICTIYDNLNMVGDSDCTIQVHDGEESTPNKQ